MENFSPNKKNEIRSHYKRLRAEIEPEVRLRLDLQIHKQIEVLPEVLAAKVAFVYLSRNGEASTQYVVQDLLEAGKTVLTPSPDITALPHDGLFRVHKEETNNHSEPVLCTESRIEHVDLIIVPGIAWDRQGFRVGFGGGYFDRLLSMARPDCINIGLAYSCQLLDKVPHEPWDEPVDIMVTEKEVIRIAEATN